MKAKKFKFTKFSINYNGVTLHQIEAISDFGNVKKGDKGGFVESADNIDGDAWVYDNAKVYGDAVVCGRAIIKGDAVVCGNAIVCGNATIKGNAVIKGDGVVKFNAVIGENALIESANDYITISNVLTYGGAVTVYKTANDELYVISNLYKGNADNINLDDRKKETTSLTIIEVAKLQMGIK